MARRRPVINAKSSARGQGQARCHRQRRLPSGIIAVCAAAVQHRPGVVSSAADATGVASCADDKPGRGMLSDAFPRGSGRRRHLRRGRRDRARPGGAGRARGLAAWGHHRAARFGECPFHARPSLLSAARIAFARIGSTSRRDLRPLSCRFMACRLAAHLAQRRSPVVAASSAAYAPALSAGLGVPSCGRPHRG